MLDPILEKYCKENFFNSDEVIVKLLEYKKLILEENKNMNLIGKSTIEDFDQRHFLDCLPHLQPHTILTSNTSSI